VDWFVEGERARIRQDARLNAGRGEVVTLLSHCRKSPQGRLWRVQFADGTETDVWGDDLRPYAEPSPNDPHLYEDTLL